LGACRIICGIKKHISSGKNKNENIYKKDTIKEKRLRYKYKTT
jgi:hypothetical protein